MESGKLEYHRPNVSLPEHLRSEGWWLSAGEGKGYLFSPNYAMSKYQESARRGYPEAQHRLGLRYYYGQGVDQDQPKALEWLKKAVDEDFLPAIEFLARVHRSAEREAAPAEETREETTSVEGAKEEEEASVERTSEGTLPMQVVVKEEAPAQRTGERATPAEEAREERASVQGIGEQVQGSPVQQASGPTPAKRQRLGHDDAGKAG